MEVESSEAATGYIRTHGFKVWIWAKPVGGRGDSAFLEATTVMPDGYEFEQVRFPDFEVFIQLGLELGDRIQLVFQHLPPRGLEVRWAGGESLGGG